MKILSLLIILSSTPFLLHSQNLIIDEGAGIGRLKLGKSYEETVQILGFKGELKTYEDYLSEELFNEDSENSLECAIGFDYYIKYEHLLALPVSYVFFKDNVINQIRVSSFPEYYFAIAQDTKTKKGLEFWTTDDDLIAIYGSPDLKVNYDSFILDSYFYFKDGITVNMRDNSYRSAHIYPAPTSAIVEQFKKEF